MNLTGNQSFDEVGLVNLPVVPMIILTICLIIGAVYLFYYDDYGGKDETDHI